MKRVSPALAEAMMPALETRESVRVLDRGKEKRKRKNEAREKGGVHRVPFAYLLP